ncbi:tryptophan synthase subunit alpha, partial [Treponema porcinum]|uniref:tryptophan synthase subunit alpha n=2 Tax=Treponema TaxID=157 RepID=UPI00235276ED
PSMAPERLEKLAGAGFKYIYAALRAGITGTNTTIDENTLLFLKNVSAGGSKVYGGFGISNGEQSAALASSVEAVVAGSVFVRLIAQYKDDAHLLSQKITEKAREITCS